MSQDKNHLNQWINASFHNLPEPVIVTNAQGIVKYINSKAEKLLKKQAKTVINQPLQSICQINDASNSDVTGSLISQVANSGNPLRIQKHLIKVRNSEKRYQINGTLSYFQRNASRESGIIILLHKIKSQNQDYNSFEIIKDNFPVGILHLNTNGIVRTANRAAVELLELVKLDQKNDLLLLDIPALKHSLIQYHFKKLLNERHKCDFDSPQINSSNGKKYYFRLRGIPRSRQNSDRDFMILIGNITERKKVEYVLREREVQLQAIIDAFDGYIYVCDRNYRVEYLNEKLQLKVGFEATNNICYEVFYARKSPCPWCENKKVFLGETVRQEIQHPVTHEWFYVINSPLFHADGNVSKQAMIMEITNQKIAENTLRQTAERLKILHEIDQAILAAKSPESIASAALRFLNQLIPCWRSSVLTFDYPKNRALILAAEFSNNTRIKSASYLPLDSFNYLKNIKPGEIKITKDLTTELIDYPLARLLYAEGLRSVLTIPLFSNDLLIGALNVGLNEPGNFSNEFVEVASEVAAVLSVAIQNSRLNEQVRKHALELEHRVAERTQELEAFSYSVSHDLRTPLRAIDGFSQILLEENSKNLDTQGQRLLHIIRMNTQKMGHLIDALLSFSRIGRQEINVCRIKMNDLVKSVFDELKIVYPTRKIILNYGELPDICCDPTMIRQVLINLIGNAIKFTQNRQTAVIEIGCNIQKNQNLYYITDNGEGFDMRYADKLFELFQSVHSPETFKGTGVGLAIVKRIIERHGGRVWAEAKIREGATFYFSLPTTNRPNKSFQID